MICKNQNIIALLLFVLALSLPFIVRSQDIREKTITWTATEVTNIAKDTTFSISCQFVSNHVASIQWLQSGGSFVTSFTVNTVTGDWDDIQENGSITYNITESGKPGVITFSKSGGQRYITIDATEEDPLGLKMKFHVSTFTVDN